MSEGKGQRRVESGERIRGERREERGERGEERGERTDEIKERREEGTSSALSHG